MHKFWYIRFYFFKLFFTLNIHFIVDLVQFHFPKIKVHSKFSARQHQRCNWLQQNVFSSFIVFSITIILALENVKSQNEKETNPFCILLLIHCQNMFLFLLMFGLCINTWNAFSQVWIYSIKEMRHSMRLITICISALLLVFISFLLHFLRLLECINNIIISISSTFVLPMKSAKNENLQHKVVIMQLGVMFFW